MGKRSEDKKCQNTENHIQRYVIACREGEFYDFNINNFDFVLNKHLFLDPAYFPGKTKK